MRLLTLLLLLPAPLLRASDPAPYAPDKGPHEIERVALLKLDKLQLKITYPKGRAKCPVIVFSHGLYGSRNAYAPLIDCWASFGWICILPDHPDSRELGRKGRLRAMLAWKDRPGEITKILDSFAAIEAQAPALKGRLDAERVAVGGHSFGAHTSQLLAGVKPQRGKKTYFDARVKAFALLSPQGEGGVFGKGSWDGVKPPVIVITGSEDKSPLKNDKGPAWRLQVYENMPAGDKYLVYVDGMHHGFGGISGVTWRGAGPDNRDQVKITQQTVLAFFDAYVRGDEKAKKWLASDAAKTAYKLTVRYERK